MHNKKKPVKFNPNIGQLPPQAQDFEQVVLGALMIDKNCVNDVMEIFVPENFYSDKNMLIAEAIKELHNNLDPIDILTVSDKLHQQGNLEKIGGMYHLTELTGRVASGANSEYHCTIINQKAYRRNLIKESSEILQMAYDETIDVFDLLDNAETKIMSVNTASNQAQFETIEKVNSDVVTEIIAAKENPGNLIGVPSGFIDLDKKTGGWKKTDLIILAARPSMGKTSLAVHMGLNASKLGKKIAIFSLEVSNKKVAKKILSIESEIETSKIDNASLSDVQFRKLDGHISNINKYGIFICDKPAINIFELRAVLRQIKSKHGLDEVIIDYLQLMSGNGNKNGTREQEISQISRDLKSIAKEFDVPVIALSQLSRAVETRGGDKRPMLSDLRESGAIEQDADMVVFLYRPSYYGFKLDQDDQPLPEGLTEAIISKNREGATGTVNLKFLNKFTKFADMPRDQDYGFLYDDNDLPDDSPF